MRVLLAVFFFGFSFLLKRKQNDKGVVLQSDGDRRGGLGLGLGLGSGLSSPTPTGAEG